MASEVVPLLEIEVGPLLEALPKKYYLRYNKSMITIQLFLQTIWASILALGMVKVIIAVVAISVLSRFQSILGLLASILFIAYLAHWIAF